MQTSNDRTLGLINRRCTNAGFLRGYESLSGLRTVVHIINGLPGETEDDMLATAGQISRMKPFGIKIHLLHVLKNTPLGEMYGRGEVGVMTLEEYVRITVRQLRILPPDTVICRLTGDGWRDELIAPEWSLHKFSVLNAIDAEVLRLGCRQGDMYSAEEGNCTK